MAEVANEQRVFGRLERIEDDGRVIGWLYDKAKPSQPRTVNILVDGSLLAAVVADRIRPDVAAAGHPTPLCGFEVDLKTIGIPIKESPTLLVSAVDAETEHMLHGSPLEIRTPPLQNSVVGWIETVTRRKVTGWGYDKSDPESKCEIELVDEAGVVISSATASIFRQDLLDSGIGDGKHGFSIALKIGETLGLNKISVRDRKTGQVIHSETLNRFLFAIDSNSLYSTSSRVTGWMIDGAKPFVRPIISIVVGGRQISVGSASLFRSDLEKMQAGDGFCGFEFAKRQLAGAKEFSIVELRTGEIVVQSISILDIPEPPSQ